MSELQTHSEFKKTSVEAFGHNRNYLVTILNFAYACDSGSRNWIFFFK
jgi:hypothetical protein